MTTPFTIDLTRPGWSQRSRWEWFLGPGGPRHLAMVAAGGVAIVVLVALGGALPRYLRYSAVIHAIANLERDVTVAGKELSSLRTNLRDLGAEARRQIRWSQTLLALSHPLPGTLRLDRVSLAKVPRQPQPTETQPGDPKPVDLVLSIEATTSVVPGGARLVEIANFMSALARDPVLAPRFQLKTWDVRPAQGGADQLHISIGLAEKRS